MRGAEVLRFRVAGLRESRSCQTREARRERGAAIAALRRREARQAHVSGSGVGAAGSTVSTRCAGHEVSSASPSMKALHGESGAR